MQHLVSPALLLLALGVGLPALSAPHPRAAVLLGQASSDSALVLGEARDAQARFERLRVLHSPRSGARRSGSCDEHVGRFCLRFGSARDDGEEPDWTPPPEPRALVEAREELLELLGGAVRVLPGDRWISGQRAAYLAEAGRWEELLEASMVCEAPGWWCHALRGWAHHGMGQARAAEGAFDVVLDLLPEEEREEWEDPGDLLDPDLSRQLAGLRAEDLRAMRDRIWLLADPLFLREGNPVRVEHFVRHVLAEVRSDARNPHALPWAGDLARLLIRYGPVVAYERVPDPPTHIGPPSVLGRYDPNARYLMPPLADAEGLARTEVDDWPTDRRRTRSRHGSPGNPRIAGMDAQVARFHRGDSLLLVAAWEPWAHPAASATPEARGVEPSSFRSGLVLLDAASLERTIAGRREGERPGGFATALVPAGGYLLSIEAYDASGGEAWRHRAGLESQPLHPEVVGLSDLLLLTGRPLAGRDEGGAFEFEFEDAVLEDLLPGMRPGARIEPGELLVAWEMYGLASSDERFSLRLSAVPEDEGLLRRAGEWIRLLSPRAGASVGWEEQLPEGHPRSRPYLRAVGLDLSDLESGAYRLTLTLSAPGRTDVITSRTIEVEGLPAG